MGDFGDNVVYLITHSLGRIGLVLLPVVLYLLFGRRAPATGKIRVVLAALALAGYLLGTGVVVVLFVFHIVAESAPQVMFFPPSQSQTRSFTVCQPVGFT